MPNINTINEQQFFDMFGEEPSEIQTVQQPNSFGSQVNDDNFFVDPKVEQKVEEEKPVNPDTPPEEIKDENTEVDDGDMFIHDEDVKKLGRKPKYNFQDTSGYFEDRIKNGKFVPVEYEKDGEVLNFVPTKPEEFDDFFDFQLDHRFKEKEKEVEENWYSSKNPAWQVVAQFADKVKHPSELIPFIQGVQNIDDISEVDESKLEGAEQIFRTWLNNRGEPSDVIEDQIEMAKAGGDEKFIALASKYKPVLIQQETQRLAQLDKQKAEEQAHYANIVRDNEAKAREAIESPIFGKQKLKDEEKYLVYDMIAVPKQELGGYGIYKHIDDLYEAKDFSTLREIALVLGKRDSYLGYAANSTKEEVATNLQKQLRASVVTKSQTNSGATEKDSQPQLRVNKNQYSQSNNFGFTR